MASAVGLICVEIFGYRDPAATAYAENLGLALQLTNIIRDVATDFARGRIYLPGEDLRAVRRQRGRPAARARDAAGRGAASVRVRPGARLLSPRGRGSCRRTMPRSLVAAEIMGGIYFEILRRIERSGLRRLQRAHSRAAAAARGDRAAHLAPGAARQCRMRELKMPNGL